MYSVSLSVFVKGTCARPAVGTGDPASERKFALQASARSRAADSKGWSPAAPSLRSPLHRTCTDLPDQQRPAHPPDTGAGLMPLRFAPPDACARRRPIALTHTCQLLCAEGGASTLYSSTVYSLSPLINLGLTNTTLPLSIATRSSDPCIGHSVMNWIAAEVDCEEPLEMRVERCEMREK